jgi:pseudouridine synthase
MKKPLQKFIAQSGFCSRRKAEDLIVQGKVRVNKEKASMGAKVAEKDKVVIQGKTIRPLKKLIYILVNKPRGYTCSDKVDPGEKSVFSLINIKEKLFIVGRLDKSSRGLILLTNDGDLGYKLTHPSFSHEKEYLVEIDQEIWGKEMEKLKKGLDIGEKTRAKIKEIKKVGKNRYQVVLTEGKNRQIKRMFQACNRTVRDLKRIRISQYKLGKIKEGSWVFTERKD